MTEMYSILFISQIGRFARYKTKIHVEIVIEIIYLYTKKMYAGWNEYKL